jgi:hypothetical protein
MVLDEGVTPIVKSPTGAAIVLRLVANLELDKGNDAPLTPASLTGKINRENIRVKEQEMAILLPKDKVDARRVEYDNSE